MVTRVLDHHAGAQRATDRDERNKDHGIRRLRAEPAPDRSRFWLPGPNWLDQGNTGHCGGMAAANEAQASPVRVPAVDTAWGHDFYYEIKRRRWDPWGLEDGTSTQAVMRLYVARGLARAYAWGFNMGDLDRQLELGTVLCGTSWLTGMFSPNADGVIHATGADEGGHLWVCSGRYLNYRAPSGRTYGRAYRVLNSWGRWGRSRWAVLPHDEMDHVVFGLNGEVGVPVDRAFPPAAVTA